MGQAPAIGCVPCPHCGKAVAIRTNGHLWHHTIAGTGRRCPSSNQRTGLRPPTREADVDTIAVRRLVNATEALISRWAEADEAVRNDLRRQLGERADVVFARFAARFAKLDRADAAREQR